ncbi:MAG: hypothetical protein MHM6MM_003271 [Cercozoa sp. M6MM]
MLTRAFSRLAASRMFSLNAMLSEDVILPRLQQALLRHEKLAEKTETDVSVTTQLQDLGLDSLDQVEAQMEIEEEFSVEIPDDDLPKLKTVGDWVTYIAMQPGAQ